MTGSLLEPLDWPRGTLEENHAWLALIDFHRAVLLTNRRAYEQARRLIEPACVFFAESGQPAREALCPLLGARISLEHAETDRARQECREAISALEELDLPHLGFRAYALLGQIEEARGEIDLEDRQIHPGETRRVRFEFEFDVARPVN